MVHLVSLLRDEHHVQGHDMSGCRDIIAEAERDTYGFPDGMLFHLVRVLCGLSRGGFNGMALGYLLQASGVNSITMSSAAERPED